MSFHRSEVLGEDIDTLIERALRRSAMPEGVTATPYLPRSKRKEQQIGKFRMIVPYSSLINDGATREALNGLADSIRTHYGADVTHPGYGILPVEVGGEDGGGDQQRSGIDLVHSKRQATATRFTALQRPTPQEEPNAWDPHQRRRQRNASRANRGRRTAARPQPYDAQQRRKNGGDNRNPLPPGHHPLAIIDGGM